MRKPKWETEMEEYVNGMTEEEVRAFLKNTKYDFYKNVKTSYLGLKGVESADHFIDTILSCEYQPSTEFGCMVPYEIDFNLTDEFIFESSILRIESISSDDATKQDLMDWFSETDRSAYPESLIPDIDFIAIVEAMSEPRDSDANKQAPKAHKTKYEYLLAA